MFPDDIEAAAQRLVKAAIDAGVWLSTAESCTGGLVGAAITSVAGSSAVYDRGFITYSNAAKAVLLGVEDAVLEAHGAVSEPVARAMAAGARERAGSDLAVSITGIAGPGGGSAEKPVGLVHFGLALPDGSTRHREMRFGDLGREQVRIGSVRVALDLLEEGLG
jgi:nicotinamide-nucleotide amidase